jgi:hypothetical protein
LDADFKQSIEVSAANTLYKKHGSGSTKLSFRQRVVLCHRQPSETLTPLPILTFYEHQNMLKARATNTPTTLWLLQRGGSKRGNPKPFTTAPNGTESPRTCIMLQTASFHIVSLFKRDFSIYYKVFPAHGLIKRLQVCSVRRGESAPEYLRRGDDDVEIE